MGGRPVKFNMIHEHDKVFMNLDRVKSYFS